MKEQIRDFDPQAVITKDNVSVKGSYAGGLFGQINSGVVSNCYSRANLKGYSSTSYKGAFAATICFSGSKSGKTFSGNMGIVEYSYFAGTFDSTGNNRIDLVEAGAGKSGSSVHNDQNTRTVGFMFDYVYDKNLASNASYDGTAGDKVLFFGGKDRAEAAKTSSEMQTQSTYTNRGFSGSYWRYSGYPTLSSEIAC